MGRRLRQSDVPHNLDWLLNQSLAAADAAKLTSTAAWISIAIDKFHDEIRLKPTCDEAFPEVRKQAMKRSRTARGSLRE